MYKHSRLSWETGHHCPPWAASLYTWAGSALSSFGLTTELGDRIPHQCDPCFPAEDSRNEVRASLTWTLVLGAARS